MQSQSLPQAAKLPVQGKVDSAKNACIVLPKTEEVVFLEESTQTSDTAGGPTSSDPALRSAHLPLKGKAIDNRASRYSYCLFPIAYCLLPIASSNSSTNQNLHATEL